MLAGLAISAAGVAVTLAGSLAVVVAGLLVLVVGMFTAQAVGPSFVNETATQAKGGRQRPLPGLLLPGRDARLLAARHWPGSAGAGPAWRARACVALGAAALAVVDPVPSRGTPS